MIILPDRKISRSKVLMPVLKKEWITPSQAQPKDCFGNENNTKFRLRARLNDGFVSWTGWFDDRDDADAFLFALFSGSLNYEKELWRLPNSEWHPGIGENLNYDFAVTTFLISPAGSNQTYNRPTDWNNGNNVVRVIGGGGGGARGAQDVAGRGGAGGGACSVQQNITISLTATYQIGSGGNGATTNNTAGGNGGDTWFNGVDLASSSVGAKGGTGSSARTGASGGLASSGIGTIKYNGGTGGTGLSVNGPGGGGGGAAGPDAAGGNGTAGGSGGGGDGGAGNGGLNGGGIGATAQGGTGGTGTNLGSGYGSGGGGGGGSGSPGPGGLGGLYGAGGGGGGTTSNSGAANGGAGRQGIISVSYEPLNLVLLNIPMLGM